MNFALLYRLFIHLSMKNILCIRFLQDAFFNWTISWEYLYVYEYVYVHPCRMKDVSKCVCVYYVCIDDTYEMSTKKQGWIGFYLNILSSKLDQKYRQHPWLKIKTTVLYQMETTRWERQTKTDSALDWSVSLGEIHPDCLSPLYFGFPQVH